MLHFGTAPKLHRTNCEQACGSLREMCDTIHSLFQRNAEKAKCVHSACVFNQRFVSTGATPLAGN